MAALFEVAQNWETIDDEGRQDLKDCVTSLVGYPCKLACKPNNGAVDIYVFSIKKNKVMDWIGIQSSGAVGVLFDMYADPNSSAIDRVDDACEAYNEGLGIKYEESESESSESTTSESDN